MVVGVSFLVFFIMSLSPIGPAYSALGETATPKALEKEYRVQHGLSDPFFVQYPLLPQWSMLHGDLGTYGVVRPRGRSGCSGSSDLHCITFLGAFFAVIIAFPSVFSPLCTATAGPTRSSARVLGRHRLLVLLAGAAGPRICSEASRPAARVQIPAAGSTADFSPPSHLAVPVIGQMTRSRAPPRLRNWIATTSVPRSVPYPQAHRRGPQRAA